MSNQKYISSVLATLLLASHSLTCFATDLPQIFVTATRSEQHPDQLNVSTRTITHDQIIDSQASDVGELLQQLTAIDFGKNGGPGQTSSIFIRGSESNHTLVLIDGVKLNPATIGGAALHNVSIDQIDRIEITKGPRSTLYGSEAIGGIIQIFTRRPNSSTSTASVSVGGGSNSTKNIAVSISQSRNQGYGGIKLGYKDTNGFPARIEGNIDSRHNNNTVQLFLGYRSNHWDGELNHWQSKGNTEFYDFFLTPVDQDFSNSLSSLTLKSSNKDRLKHTLIISQGHDDITQNQSVDFAFSKRRTLDWQTNIKTKSLWTTGVTLTDESTQSESFGTGFDESTTIYAVFLQQQINNGNHHGLWALRYTNHDAFNGHITGELSYGKDLANDGYAYVSTASGFRAPDAIDRFGFGGNPDLDPEVSRNIELGLRQRINNHRFEINLYQNQIKDLIVFNDPDGFLGPVPGVNQNINEARISGIELSHRLKSNRWSSVTEITLSNPKNQQTGSQLARRAKQNLRWQGNYKHKHHQSGVELIARSQRPDSDFNDEINRSYAIVNITTKKKLNLNWNLSARIENIFDKNYTLANGFNTQGRGAWVQLRYSKKP